MEQKRLVIIGLLGPSLDNGKGPERWERWRPSVSLCQHDDLLVHRFELLHDRKFGALSKVVREDIASVSPETTVCVHEVGFDDAWDFEGVYGALLDFARGYPFKPEEEEYLIHITTGSHVAQICLFLLTESRYLPARLIQTAPPNKHRGDAGSYAIVDLDLSKYDRLAARFGEESKESTSFLKSGIETRNKAFNRLIEQIEQVAVGSKAPILLMGPTGAGKSQLARRIYELKKQRRQIEGKFVEVNCATVRGDGAMSTLFGHVRGAFTGAVGERPGLLRAADGGLLFLDEVGELGLDEQAMLLRAIEERRFLPVGSDKEVKSDFQLIAGTNCDLQSAVGAGRFREDLLARMNLWTFRLPALRERREDIEPNLDYELEQFARNHGMKVTFNKEARERFVRFAMEGEAAWNGNFRDLNAAVIRMATFAAGGRVSVEIVDGEIERLRASWSATGGGVATVDLETVCDEEKLAGIDPFDRVQLAEVVRVCQGSRNLSEAGRKLFAVSRMKKGTSNDADRLRKYLGRFGLDWGKLQVGKD
ncbi:MAG TPA: RNA repair transcriptional activator RtcR [Tepidisphaeraceae bacterium]|jgi:transcriptional regulatory protein RtcR|nr:RNA repair transcriptional activator RtcR [Tepidisphaeraceae bacterium]